MRNNLLSVLCMTLLCAFLMLSIMGIYRLIGNSSREKRRFVSDSPIHTLTDIINEHA